MKTAMTEIIELFAIGLFVAGVGAIGVAMQVAV